MVNSSSDTIQKLEAARRQLRTAIQLWFADGDPISIHTLSCAAHQIIHDIHTHRGGYALLFNSVYVKDHRRAEWTRAVKEHMNFFKHANKDPYGAIAFNPTLTEPFILFSLFGIENLGEYLTHEESVFIIWSCLHNPDWLSEKGQSAFIDRIPVKQLAQLRNVTKVDFYKMFKLVMGQ